MPKSQLKLMAALSGFVLLVVGVSGFVAQRGLREREVERTARSLEARAGLVREMIGVRALGSGDREQLDAIADRAGAAAEARVTLIDPAGWVVGDSDVPPDRLPGVANHADRPEVQEALAGRVGQSRRRSETVGRELVYLAIPVDAGRGGAVRVAMELADLHDALAGLRNVLLLSGALGLIAAVALSYGLAWFTLRPVREIQLLTSVIADGDLYYRIPRRSGDELGAISDAIHRMADQLRERIDEATNEKEQLQAVLNSMIEGVLVVDAELRVVLANQRLKDMLGVSGRDHGMSLMEFARYHDLETVVQDAANTDELVTRTISVTHPVDRVLQVHAVRFPAGSGERLGTVAVVHDMTEVAKLNSVRRQFVANASHELRTPLTAIQGFSETLLSSDDLKDPNSRFQVEIIHRNAERLGRLVADLLQLSETEGEETKLEPTRLDLAALVARVVRDSQSNIRESEVDVIQRSNGSVTAWADIHAAEQVVRNLLDNACQYTAAGGRVEINVEGEDGRACVRVSDTGIGIAERDLGRIFERFYRVDKARSREAGGTGLGLSIVKHLVQRMNGEISVESSPGRGSTFTLRLPLANS